MKTIVVASLLVISIFGIAGLKGQSAEMDGTLKIGNDNSSPEPGTIRWTGSNFEGWDGENWVSFYSPVYGTVEDLDGNIYRTVQIGEQRWMTQNLKVTQYNDGTPLFLSESKLNWDSANNLGIGVYCAYNFNDSIAAQYGYLYNASAITSGFSVCPVGWHIPSKSEFETLVSHVTTRLSGRGGNLKSMGILEFRTGLWKSPNTNATDSHGFNAIPSGLYTDGGTFFRLNEFAAYWTSTPINGTLFYGSIAFNSDLFIIAEGGGPNVGNAIRCIKD